MSVLKTMKSKEATDEICHANDALQHFYMEAKRNKKIARWAAKKLDKNRKKYFLELVSEDISHAGPKPVIKRILKDFKTAGIKIKEEEIWAKLRRFECETLSEMLREHGRKVKKELKKKSKK
ncbi:ATPase inhibitor subunit zeta [Terasakiella sp. SH-1]|uniref:ATPase inhibitor subunit zeta n=1 Tax=Terasakiella sp. SH-1 TaxID=2560057 RepID=UPI00107333D4|nr:ATPase inhibitor subunit zeta [Terasakiella sp. SH-1]